MIHRDTIPIVCHSDYMCQYMSLCIIVFLCYPYASQNKLANGYKSLKFNHFKDFLYMPIWQKRHFGAVQRWTKLYFRTSGGVQLSKVFFIDLQCLAQKDYKYGA